MERRRFVDSGTLARLPNTKRESEKEIRENGPPRYSFCLYIRSISEIRVRPFSYDIKIHPIRDELEHILGIHVNRDVKNWKKSLIVRPA